MFKLGQIGKYEIPNDLLNKLDHQMLAKNKEYAFTHMLTRDNELVLNLKRQYAFYNTTVLYEFNRIKNLNGDNHKKQFIRVSEKHTDILTDVR